MADSGVIRNPKAALERIVAVDTPIRPTEPTGIMGILPTLVTLAIAVVVVLAGISFASRFLLGRDAQSAYMPFSQQ